MMQSSEQAKLVNVRHPMRVLASALFWCWTLIWASNAANAGWPTSAPEMFAPVRLGWIGAQLVFVLLVLRPQVLMTLDRKRLFQFSAPSTAAATLVVVLVDGTSPAQLTIAAVASILAGWSACGMLPIWTSVFETDHFARLNILIMSSALGAVALFHLVMLLPAGIAIYVFSALPILSGLASILDPIDSAPTTKRFRPESDNVYRFVDLGYVVVGFFAAAIFGLDVLDYDFVPKTQTTFVLLLVGMLVSFALVIALYSLLKRTKGYSGYHSILPLLVMGALSLPYMFSDSETLIQIAVGSSYVCWFLVFTLTQSDTVHHVRIGKRTVPVTAAWASAFVSVIAVLLGFTLSRTTHMGNDLISGVLVGLTYIVVIGTTLLISSRIAIFARSRETEGPVPICDACVGLAEANGLTPRETEILEILAAGRSQAYVQKTLMIAKGTATTHISHIYQKLGIHSREELLDVVQEYSETNGDSPLK